MTQIIDLTHTISENMPVYPGTEQPKLILVNSYEESGFKETFLNLYSHTGTHMDAPAHVLKNRTMLDEFSVDQFVGTAVIIDCSDLNEGEQIDISYINKDIQKVNQADFLLFYTGWDKKWGSKEYFGEYPYLSNEVVQYIIDNNKKGIGLDVIGVDPISDISLSIHKKLFANNEIVVIENLCNLNKVGSELFSFIALPLKYENADGAPVRAIAIVEKSF